MANYKRCRIRIYPKNGRINIDDFKKNIEQLKLENNIYENIDAFYSENMKFGEIQFTVRRYPSPLEEVFDLEENDLWLIVSDESGSSDYIRFETNNKDLFGGFDETAIYESDYIKLIGDRIKIKANLESIFGYLPNYLSKEIENGIGVRLKCLYTGNNFLRISDEGNIHLHSFENEFVGTLLNTTGEFWQMLFDIDGIKFKERFYDQCHRFSRGENSFPFLEKVEFYNKDRLTNRIEWTINQHFSEWRHFSGDGFWNCVNHKFYAYQLFNN